jgi:hypothetical protein
MVNLLPFYYHMPNNRQSPGPLVTTEWVLTEVGDGLASVSQEPGRNSSGFWISADATRKTDDTPGKESEKCYQGLDNVGFIGDHRRGDHPPTALQASSAAKPV